MIVPVNGSAAAAGQIVNAQSVLSGLCATADDRSNAIVMRKCDASDKRQMFVLDADKLGFVVVAVVFL